MSQHSLLGTEPLAGFGSCNLGFAHLDTKHITQLGSVREADKKKLAYAKNRKSPLPTQACTDFRCRCHICRTEFLFRSFSITTRKNFSENGAGW